MLPSAMLFTNANASCAFRRRVWSEPAVKNSRVAAPHRPAAAIVEYGSALRTVKWTRASAVSPVANAASPGPALARPHSSRQSEICSGPFSAPSSCAAGWHAGCVGLVEICRCDGGEFEFAAHLPDAQFGQALQVAWFARCRARGCVVAFSLP